MNAEEIQVVLVTAPSEETAASLAHELVERKLAACVNIVPQIQSIFRWQGNIEKGTECLMIVKTTLGRYPALEAAVNELHPYEVPEVLALNVRTGLSGYCAWVAKETAD